MVNLSVVLNYCRTPELIENYDIAMSDKENRWVCHHRLGVYYSVENMKKKGIYYNINPEALIFVTQKEHCKIHKYHKGYKHEDSTKETMSKSKMEMDDEKKTLWRKHLSESHKGKSSPMKGKKGKPRSEETKLKMSLAHKGKKLTIEHKKHISEARKRLFNV